MENNYRVATGRVVDEFRNMKVGDVVRFPYANYSSLYVTQAPRVTALRRLVEKGAKWKVSASIKLPYCEVTKISDPCEE